MEWDSSEEIIGYDSSWVPDTTMFNVPAGTKSLYVAKGYPSDRIIDPAVTRLDVTLTVPPVACTVGEVVTVPVTVTDENSDPVTKGQVTVTIGQDTYTGSVASGTASLSIPTTSMTSGTYTMNIAYTENDTYNAGTTTSTLTINKHTVQITVPDITGTVGDTVSVPVSLVDENNLPVSNGTVSAELELVSRKGISIVTASGYDWDLEFVSATVFDDGGTDMLNCTLHVVDRNTDEIITDFNGSFADNVLMGTTDVGYQIVFPNLTYDTASFSQGVITIGGSVTDLATLLDTTKEIVTLNMSYNKAGEQATVFELVQDYTEEEAE